MNNEMNGRKPPQNDLNEIKEPTKEEAKEEIKEDVKEEESSTLKEKVPTNKTKKKVIKKTTIFKKFHLNKINLGTKPIKIISSCTISEKDNNTSTGHHFKLLIQIIIGIVVAIILYIIARTIGGNFLGTDTNNSNQIVENTINSNKQGNVINKPSEKSSAIKSITNVETKDENKGKNDKDKDKNKKENMKEKEKSDNGKK